MTQADYTQVKGDQEVNAAASQAHASATKRISDGQEKSQAGFLSMMDASRQSLFDDEEPVESDKKPVALMHAPEGGEEQEEQKHRPETQKNGGCQGRDCSKSFLL